jgi:FkbM family methyltransferase
MSDKRLRPSRFKSLLSRKAVEARSPVTRRLARLGLRVAEPFGSDTISFDAGGYAMLLPSSHPLPRYWNEFPNYDRALPRLVRSLSEFTGSAEFVIVDIGANVGDTAIALLQAPASYVIAIEGNPVFLPYLQYNLADFAHRSVIIDQFIGPENAQRLTVQTRNGTAKLVHADDNATSVINMIGLDKALAKTGKSVIDLIKIDTDGFDVQIIMNSLSMLSASDISIFFEFDPRLAEPITGPAWTIYDILERAGYHFGIAYLNTGEFVRSFEMSDEKAIHELRALLGSAPSSAYLDLAIFKNEARFSHVMAAELSHFTDVCPTTACAAQ